VTPPAPLSLPLDTTHLTPGLRLAVALSGGGDSVALTLALAARASELGLVLHAAHLHHGLRGPEADADQRFSADLAQSLGLVFHIAQVDTAAEAELHKESIEEAARRLRYTWFRRLLEGREVDAIATAHTLDDQAETVLAKLLRGAWTEGLSGIHPVVHFPEGRILRPLLAVTRAQVESYLHALNQPWREDASNLDPAFTRNRIRHQLLPELDRWNPALREHLANMALLARDEESYWTAELARISPQLILTGRPVRGGGRASTVDASLALDVVRLAALHPALQRRLLRHAASTLAVSLSFAHTESIRALATTGRSGQKLTLPGQLLAERTPRELRLTPSASPSSAKSLSVKSLSAKSSESHPPHPEVPLPIPGQARAFGLQFHAQSATPQPPARIRASRAGDRVTLRYSSGPRKIKEVLERLKISASDRANWPVVAWQGQILWMLGAELQPIPEVTISAQPAPES
jgi:tRNA(Ile)-lysidine synthase